MQTDILPDRKETEESTEPEEEQKQKNSRWEKEPENVEMKLWAVGKDQAGNRQPEGSSGRFR